MITRLIVFFILLFEGIFLFAQDSARFSVADTNLYSLSIEELLELTVPVQVSSSEGDVIFKTPSSTTIITRTQIEAYNFDRISDLLETVAGVHIGRSYLKRNITTVRGVLQDHYANKVLILVNGNASWNAVTGEGCIDMISLQDVERIEVLKGPASVMYGTNSYAGTVNIITRKIDELGGEMRFGVGTQSALLAGASVGHSSSDFNIYSAVNMRNAEGEKYLFADEEGHSERVNEYVNASNIFVNAGYKNHSVTANAYKVEESFLGPAPKFSMGAGNPHYISGFLLAYNFRRELSERFYLSSSISSDYVGRNISRSYTDSIRGNIQGLRITFNCNVRYDINSWLQSEVGIHTDKRHGIEYKDYVVSTGELANVSWSEADTVMDGNNGMKGLGARESSVFMQLKARLSKLTLTTGSRITANVDFGNNLSCRFSAIYAFGNKNSAKIIYGESFRAPSFFEQRFFYQTVMGNPGLEPETSRSLECVYLKSFRSVFVQILGFVARYDNNIYRESQEMSVNDHSLLVSRYENGGALNSYGAEFELKYARPHFKVFVNYAYVDGSHGDSLENRAGYNFRYVSNHTLSAGSSVNVKGFVVSGTGNYWSAVDGPFAPIHGQYNIDLKLSYKHRFQDVGLKHTLSAANVTGNRLELPEYSRRRVLNSVSAGLQRSIFYTLILSF